MQKWPVLALAGIGILVACSQFGAADEPPSDGVDAGAPDAPPSGADGTPGDEPAAPGCTNRTPAQCSGTVELLDFTGVTPNIANTTTRFSRADDPCGVLTVEHAGGSLGEGYFVRELGPGPGHFVVHHRITGPLAMSNKTPSPLTFGCGLFVKTDDANDLVETRFEIAEREFEIDGENPDDGYDPEGDDPPADPSGMDFGTLLPSPIEERTFDLEVVVIEDEGGIGTMTTVGKINGTSRTSGPIGFVGKVTSKHLRCGLIHVDPAEKTPSSLTIRQMELEICPP